MTFRCPGYLDRVPRRDMPLPGPSQFDIALVGFSRSGSHARPAGRVVVGPGGREHLNIVTTSLTAFLALVGLAGGQMRGPTAPDPVTSLAVVGDSYAAGIGADPGHAWEQYTALDLGWSLTTVRAYPGSGYVNPGTLGAGPYEAALAADPLPVGVRQVIVQGGFNDIAYDPAQVGAAMGRTLALVHAQAPQAAITVVGTFDPGPGTFTADYPNLHGNGPVLRQAVEAAGARYVDGLPFRYEVGPDQTHPSPTGHSQLGHAIAAAIRSDASQPVGTRPTSLKHRGSAVIGVSRVDASGVRWFHVAGTTDGVLGPVTSTAFGDAGDIPTLVPDATGQCRPAVYRPSTGTLYTASSAVDGGAPVQAVPFGDTGDQPVLNAAYGTPAGRSVLIRRPAADTFFQQVVHPGGELVTSSLAFGDPTDHGLLVSVAGGGTTLGVHRPANSTFYFAAPEGPSVAPVTSVPFGDPGDQGLVGAWGGSNTDGSDHVGVFRPSTAQWFLADTATPLTGGPATPITSVTSFTFGDPGDTALTCDPE